MTLTRSQFLFYVLFLSTFFLITVLGETPIGIFLWGVLGLVFLVFQSLLSRSKPSGRHPVALAFLVLFYIGSLLSTFFTLSIPLTLNAFVLMSLAVLAFDFFYHSSSEKLPLQMILYGFLLIGLNISLLSLLFFFFPNLGAHLPGMNLLIANFGHNHGSILFLFCIPIAFLLINEAHGNRYSYIPLGIFFTTLILSFARVDILIGILQIAFFFGLRLRKNEKGISSTVKVVIGIAGLLAIVGFVLSSKMKTEKICFTTAINQQTCKEFTSDFRIQYWTQAVHAIKEKPLLGWGGGSFTLISNQKADLPYYFTSYTHNLVLQLLVEYGIVFSLPFFFLLIYVIVVCFPKKETFRKPSSYLFIAVLSLLIDSLFDFNLSYSSIWVLFFISLALLLREQSGYQKFWKPLEKFFSQPVPEFFTNLFLKCSFVILIIWMVGYVSSTALWYAGKTQQSVQIFPFVYWRVQEVLKTAKSDSYLLNLYSQSPEMLNSYLAQSDLPVQDEITYRKRLMQLTPFDLPNKFTLLTLLSAQNMPEQYLSVVENIRLTYQGKKVELLDLGSKREFFDQATKEANRVSVKNVALGSKIYASLAQFDLGLATSHSFDAFVSPDRYPPKELKDAIQLLESTNYLVNYKKTLTPWLLEQVKSDLRDNHFDLAKEDVQLLVLVDEGNRWKAWNVYSTQFAQQLTQFSVEKGSNDRQYLLKSWYEVWKILDTQNPNQAIEFSWKEMLVENLVQEGNRLYQLGNIDEAVKVYIQAQDIDPFFEQHTPFVFIDPAYDHQKFELFMKALQKAEAIQTFSKKYALKKPIQTLINEQIAQKNWQFVQQLLRAYSHGLAEDYFASAQLANYYYFKGDKEAARREYDICLGHFKNPEQETDCYWGKFDLDHETQNGELRYFRISQELLKN